MFKLTKEEEKTIDQVLTRMLNGNAKAAKKLRKDICKNTTVGVRIDFDSMDETELNDKYDNAQDSFLGGKLVIHYEMPIELIAKSFELAYPEEYELKD